VKPRAIPRSALALASGLVLGAASTGCARCVAPLCSEKLPDASRIATSVGSAAGIPLEANPPVATERTVTKVLSTWTGGADRSSLLLVVLKRPEDVQLFLGQSPEPPPGTTVIRRGSLVVLYSPSPVGPDRSVAIARALGAAATAAGDA
jgi:hypothetical protein